MLKMGVMFGLIGAAAISVTAAPQQQSGLPNSFLTPGNTRKVTKEQVCAADYATAMKPLKESTKDEAFGRYGVRLDHANGDVLGLNDQIQTSSGDSAGVGFATPGNADVQVANTIISGKKVEHAYVGVSLAPSGEGGAEIAPQGTQGEPSIEPGSPAAQAGLEPGDLITAVNGQKVTSTDAFIAKVSQDDPGQTITLTIKRDGQIKQIKVKLGTQPAKAPADG